MLGRVDEERQQQMRLVWAFAGQNQTDEYGASLRQ